MNKTAIARYATIAAAIAGLLLAEPSRAADDEGFGCPAGGYGPFGKAAYEKQALPTVDYDGDPYAYAPDDSGRDFLANGGHPGNWWAIQTDTGRPNGKPLTTTLANPSTGKRQAYYISLIIGWVDGKPVDRLDAKNFSFSVLTSEMVGKGIKLGDWVSIVNPVNGRSVCARVEDFGNGGLGGEVSECVADLLGLNYTRRGVKDKLSISVEAFNQTRSIKGASHETNK